MNNTFLSLHCYRHEQRFVTSHKWSRAILLHNSMKILSLYFLKISQNSPILGIL